MGHCSVLVSCNSLRLPVCLSSLGGAVVCPMTSVLQWVKGELFSLLSFLLVTMEGCLPSSLCVGLETGSHMLLRFIHIILCISFILLSGILFYE